MSDLTYWECVEIERGLRMVIGKNKSAIMRRNKPFVPESGKRDANVVKIETASSALEKIKQIKREIKQRDDRRNNS